MSARPRPAELAAVRHVVRAIMLGHRIDPEAERAPALVRRHALAPLAFEAGASWLRAERAAEALRAEQRSKTLDEALEALAARGIEVVLLKGISYAGGLYRDPGLRPMGDIDVLVRERCFADAVVILGELGYRDRTTGGGTALHHAWQLGRGDGTSIDLHRSILQRWRGGIDLEAVWRRSAPARDRPLARRLDPVDELLFHWAHMARSELYVPLVTYVDSLRLWQRLDPEQKREIWQRASRFRLVRASRASLAITVALRDGARRAQPRGWLRVLPDCDEIATGALPPRPVQLVRKALLNDSPLDAAALALVYGSRRAAAGLTRTLRRQWGLWS